jgi:hypothetical protein
LRKIGEFSKMKITLPLAFLLFAVLMATVPGSLAAPEGTCPEIDVTTVYLPDNEQCEYEKKT